MSNETFFNDDWLGSAAQVLGQLGGDEPQGHGHWAATAKLTAPWEGALDHWWKALSPGAPDASKAFMEKMMDQGKSSSAWRKPLPRAPATTLRRPTA